MARSIGVLASFEFPRVPLKQLALMFDQVAAPGSERERTRNGVFVGKGTLMPVEELRWLLDQGIVMDPDKLAGSPVLSSDDEEERLAESLKRLETQYRALNSKIFFPQSSYDSRDKNREGNSNTQSIIVREVTDPKDIARFEIRAELKRDYSKITLSAVLKTLYKMDAFPITSPFFCLPSGDSSGIADVVRVSLFRLPVPDDSTSWEHIVEFRTDPDTRAKFLDLRNWMNEVARAKLTPIEVEQKLDYLLSRYERHMQLHRMKINTGTLETCLTVGAEFLEGVLHFKPSQAVKALFALKHQRIALQESELTSPGSEVAYIVKACNKLSKKP